MRLAKGSPQEIPMIVIGVLIAVVLLVALETESIAWLVGAAVLVGSCYAARTLVPRIRAQLDASAQRQVEVGRRADQQHAWTLRGDQRGVYGPDGVELMRSLSPEPQLGDAVPETGENPDVAAIAYTAADLAALSKERLPYWHWAAFGSVLVQRRAALRSRLHDQRLGYAPPSGPRAHTNHEVARLVREWADELLALVDQTQDLMLSAAFQELFSTAYNADTADADTILQTAHRLMDLHERALVLAEACRGLAAPASSHDLLRDCAHLMDVPLAGYRGFIDDFVTRMAEIPECLRWARGHVELDPVQLDLDGPDELLDSFFERLQEIESS